MIATTSMVVMLLIAIPLAYHMAFKARRWEILMLLALVLADELAPVVKIYAWQTILGRNGILNFRSRARRWSGSSTAGSR